MAAHELTMGNPRTFLFINELTARWRFALTVVVQALRAMLTLVGESSACFASRQFRTHFRPRYDSWQPRRRSCHREVMSTLST